MRWGGGGDEKEGDGEKVVTYVCICGLYIGSTHYLFILIKNTCQLVYLFIITFLSLIISHLHHH